MSSVPKKISHAVVERVIWFMPTKQSCFIFMGNKKKLLSSMSQTNKMSPLHLARGEKCGETFSDKSTGRKFPAEYLSVCLCGRWNACVTPAPSEKSRLLDPGARSGTPLNIPRSRRRRVCRAGTWRRRPVVRCCPWINTVNTTWPRHLKPPPPPLL